MYDVIVVGARCAGSPTALLLARKGYRVLLVDRATFPSDLPLSTHLLWQPGVARLKHWGLLERVQASNCPPLSKVSFDLGPFALAGTPRPADGITAAYSPRRRALDQLLIDAAVEAAVDFQEGVAVRELSWDGGRVTGIRGKTTGGATVEESARLVIGADGLHSTVANAVQATEYQVRPALQGTYFTYWSGVPMDGIELYARDYRFVYGWQTNDALTLIGVNWAIQDFHGIQHDIEGSYRAVLTEAAPGLAERVRGGQQQGRWIGGAVRNFFRAAHGPGWALVGDAGYNKDPCTAQGMSDAFREAELLAEAVDAGLSGSLLLDTALADYGRQRDAALLPMYEFTCQLAHFAPPPPETQQLFAALHGNQVETDQFFGVIAGTVPVQNFFAPEHLASIVSVPPAGGTA